MLEQTFVPYLAWLDSAASNPTHNPEVSSSQFVHCQQLHLSLLVFHLRVIRIQECLKIHRVFTFKTANGESSKIIFREGDDLRQEQLIFL